MREFEEGKLISETPFSPAEQANSLVQVKMKEWEVEKTKQEKQMLETVNKLREQVDQEKQEFENEKRRCKSLF